MKKTLIVIAALFLLGQLKGQETNQLNDMIISSIRSEIAWNDNYLMERGWQKQEHCYVCSDGFPRDFPYNNDSLKNVTYFSLAFASVYQNPFKKELKKGIGFLEVGYRLTNNTLRISVVPASIKRKSGQFFVEVNLEDIGIYFYEYSCDKQKWELMKIRKGGKETLLNP